MRAEIICVGTELLVGSITNTNSKFLSQKLAENAIDVYHHVTVGDNEGRLLDALEFAAKRADILITSGGLGPTEDDITSRTIAKFLHVERSFNYSTYRRIVKRFKERRLRVDAIAKEQCYVPEGALVMDNAKGTAPGLLCEFSRDDEKKWLIVLPGPPRELEPMFTEQALPLLFKKIKFRKQGFTVRAVRIGGMLETQVAKKVPDLLKLKPPVTVGIYAKPGEVELKIMSKADSAAIAKRAADKIEKTIRRRMGSFVYGVDSDTLASATGALLRSRRQTVATAESCTGGLLAHILTQPAGASQYYLGSVIAYSNKIKTNELGVPKTLLTKVGAVSPEVAALMAKGIRKKMNSTYGIGITGIAGPDGGTKRKPVGLVYVSVSGPKRTKTFQLNLLGTRAEIKFSTAQKAVGFLRLEIISSSRNRARRN
jgi:nicotinamide-nucleotide amidase